MATLEQYAVLPRVISLPKKIDIGHHIEQFAKDHGFEAKDVSRMFDRHNASLQGVSKACQLISDRCKKYPNTMHYIVTSEYNLEAVAKYLDAIFRFDEYIMRGSPLVFGSEMLHAVVFLNNMKLPLHNVKKESQVMISLKCFEPDGECVVCLTDFDQCETASPFDCRHQFCSACANKIHACPLCRSNAKASPKIVYKKMEGCP
eukprot:320824-Prymnesium_polylepis.2